MTIQKAHLRKLLQVFFLPENQLTTVLRNDIRAEIARSEGASEGGGDFHAPFWSDAKDHACGISELETSTDQRIAKNARRRRLYPLLRAGFLEWWNEKLRWSNEIVEAIQSGVKGQVGFTDINSIVKVENLLAVEIGDHSKKLIYPYFSENPILSGEAARIGLWLMSEALPRHDVKDMRILDVLRSSSITVVDHPLEGNEERLFVEHYSRILRRRRQLRREYD